MTDRLDVLKTYKLYIGGGFPRSESGRSELIKNLAGDTVAHSCKASRKDLRDAVGAARKALGGWSNATAYNRGQILYRMAEMLEARKSEFVALLDQAASTEAGAQAQARAGASVDQVVASVDRLVAYAGWADKYSQVLGCQNPVAGPFWNITVPEPTGVIGVVCPASQSLLALVSLVAPVIVSGNTCVVISPAYAPMVSTFGEVCATSDVPGGVINLLTGSLDELVPVLAKHRDVDGVHAGAIGAELAKTLREGSADNLKRVTLRGESVNFADHEACATPWWIERFVEFKTVWHPVGT